MLSLKLRSLQKLGLPRHTAHTEHHLVRDTTWDTVQPTSCTLPRHKDMRQVTATDRSTRNVLEFGGTRSSSPSHPRDAETATWLLLAEFPPLCHVWPTQEKQETGRDISLCLLTLLQSSSTEAQVDSSIPLPVPEVVLSPVCNWETELSPSHAV